MRREEAINLIKQVLPCLNIDEKIREGFVTLIPELKENEDERIKKYLIEKLKAAKSVGELLYTIPQPTREECIAYLEKQKEASKAIEAVDRIDKYIDEHLANAHDMKDSNPDKKYYRGWDDALGKMARILQDVYSGEKQKEQKPAEWSEDDKRILDEAIGMIEARGCWVRSEDAVEQVSDFLKSLPDRFNLQPKQEWSEEDEKMVERIVETIQDYALETGQIDAKTGGTKEPLISYINFLWSLRPSWRPSDEQMEALNALNLYGNISYVGQQNQLISLYQDLKKLM